MTLGVLGPQQSVDLSPKAKPADRSTFCPMPGGRFQAASDAIRTEAVSLDPRNRKLGRWNKAGAKKAPSLGESPRVRKVIRTHALQQTTKLMDRAGEQEMRHCELLNWPELRAFALAKRRLFLATGSKPGSAKKTRSWPNGAQMSRPAVRRALRRLLSLAEAPMSGR